MERGLRRSSRRLRTKQSLMQQQQQQDPPANDLVDLDLPVNTRARRSFSAAADASSVEAAAAARAVVSATVAARAAAIASRRVLRRRRSAPSIAATSYPTVKHQPESGRPAKWCKTADTPSTPHAFTPALPLAKTCCICHVVVSSAHYNFMRRHFGLDQTKAHKKCVKQAHRKCKATLDALESFGVQLFPVHTYPPQATLPASHSASPRPGTGSGMRASTPRAPSFSSRCSSRCSSRGSDTPAPTRPTSLGLADDVDTMPHFRIKPSPSPSPRRSPQPSSPAASAASAPVPAGHPHHAVAGGSHMPPPSGGGGGAAPQHLLEYARGGRKRLRSRNIAEGDDEFITIQTAVRNVSTSAAAAAASGASICGSRTTTMLSAATPAAAACPFMRRTHRHSHSHSQQVYDDTASCSIDALTVPCTSTMMPSTTPHIPSRHFAPARPLDRDRTQERAAAAAAAAAATAATVGGVPSTRHRTHALGMGVPTSSALTHAPPPPASFVAAPDFDARSSAAAFHTRPYVQTGVHMGMAPTTSFFHTQRRSTTQPSSRPPPPHPPSHSHSHHSIMPGHHSMSPSEVEAAISELDIDLADLDCFEMDEHALSRDATTVVASDMTAAMTTPVHATPMSRLGGGSSYGSLPLSRTGSVASVASSHNASAASLDASRRRHPTATATATATAMVTPAASSSSSSGCAAAATGSLCGASTAACPSSSSSSSSSPCSSTATSVAAAAACSFAAAATSSVCTTVTTSANTTTSGAAAAAGACPSAVGSTGTGHVNDDNNDTCCGTGTGASTAQPAACCRSSSGGVVSFDAATGCGTGAGQPQDQDQDHHERVQRPPPHGALAHQDTCEWFRNDVTDGDAVTEFEPQSLCLPRHPSEPSWAVACCRRREALRRVADALPAFFESPSPSAARSPTAPANPSSSASSSSSSSSSSSPPSSSSGASCCGCNCGCGSECACQSPSTVSAGRTLMRGAIVDTAVDCDCVSTSTCLAGSAMYDEAMEEVGAATATATATPTATPTAPTVALTRCRSVHVTAASCGRQRLKLSLDATALCRAASTSSSPSPSPSSSSSSPWPPSSAKPGDTAALSTCVVVSGPSLSLSLRHAREAWDMKPRDPTSRTSVSGGFARELLTVHVPLPAAALCSSSHMLRLSTAPFRAADIARPVPSEEEGEGDVDVDMYPGEAATATATATPSVPTGRLSRGFGSSRTPFVPPGGAAAASVQAANSSSASSSSGVQGQHIHVTVLVAPAACLAWAGNTRGCTNIDRLVTNPNVFLFSQRVTVE